MEDFYCSWWHILHTFVHIWIFHNSKNVHSLDILNPISAIWPPCENRNTYAWLTIKKWWKNENVRYKFALSRYQKRYYYYLPIRSFARCVIPKSISWSESRLRIPRSAITWMVCRIRKIRCFSIIERYSMILRVLYKWEVQVNKKADSELWSRVGHNSSCFE